MHASSPPSVDTVPKTVQETSAEKVGSKLSAAPEPFNPRLISVLVTSVYDVRASEAMLSALVIPSVAARVSCGPRSPFYYKTNYSFRMRQGVQNFRIPLSEKSASEHPRIMKPYALEFVPVRSLPSDNKDEYATDINASFKMNKVEEMDENSNAKSKRKSISKTEKSELARQILLSVRVKSVKHSRDSESESQEKEKRFDAVENDNAIIEIHYGNEGKAKPVSQLETTDVDTNEVIDTEGFTVVTKKEKKQAAVQK